ncbi:MAG: hypothetical protein VW882_07755 [Gammaproteobacteria bacterium]
MKSSILKNTLVSFSTISILILGTSTSAGPSAKNKKVFDYWTPERIASEVPRDMVIDKKNGLG